jgi:UDP-4-amino-4-deoxy-L-arabinose-oxoglutarate aminotransferase
MYGQMCDIKAIKEIIPSGQKIAIIEDCAHSFEAKLNGERPGKYSDAAIFSFYATKNVTCGEGGAIITNDSILFERITQAILHGMSAGAADRFKAGQYKHWGMDHLGTKANLPDLLACFLPAQIKTIDERLTLREKIAQNYEKALLGSGILVPVVKPGIVHSRHLFPIQVGSKVRDRVLLKLGEMQVGATVNYRAVTTMNFYKQKYQIQSKTYEISETWGEGTLTIPLFENMKSEEQDYVIDILLNEVSPMIGSKLNV